MCTVLNAVEDERRRKYTFRDVHTDRADVFHALIDNQEDSQEKRENLPFYK